jgi:hypothetical protein
MCWTEIFANRQRLCPSEGGGGVVNFFILLGGHGYQIWEPLHQTYVDPNYRRGCNSDNSLGMWGGAVGSNLGRYTGYPDWVISWPSTVPPRVGANTQYFPICVSSHHSGAIQPIYTQAQPVRTNAKTRWHRTLKPTTRNAPGYQLNVGQCCLEGCSADCSHDGLWNLGKDLTPWSRILAKPQLLRFLKKSSAFSRTIRFITVCTTANARPYVKYTVLLRKMAQTTDLQSNTKQECLPLNSEVYRREKRKPILTRMCTRLHHGDGIACVCGRLELWADVHTGSNLEEKKKDV